LRRKAAVLLVALPLLGLVPAAQADRPPLVEVVSDETGPLDTAADLEQALRFEALIPQHTVEGAVVTFEYDKWPHLDASATPTNMHGEPDSGNYTGVYLAAQSFRYAQAKNELAKLHADPLGTADTGSPKAKFWRAQRDEARTRAAEIVRYYHVLVNIAEEWKTEFDPKIDDTKEPLTYGWFDYGGGLVPGEKGLLMRVCTRDGVTPYYKDVRRNHDGHPGLRGPWTWTDGNKYYCVQNTSRDSYAGTYFGLSIALDFLGAENGELRSLLAADIRAMTDYALKYLWFQPRPHGTVANPAMGDNDLNGPVSPLFHQVALHRMNMLQTAMRAAELTGDSTGQLTYQALLKAETAAALPGTLMTSQLIDASNPHNDYYKFQLNLMSWFNLTRLEKDPVVRAELLRAISPEDATLTDDGNAFFEAIFYGITGEKQRLDEAVDLHRQWLDYHAFHEAVAATGNTPFLHRGRCDITESPGPDAPVAEQPLKCRTKDEVDMHQTLPNGETLTVVQRPGTVTDKRAEAPLPVGVRRLADFLWQKDPTIVGGDHVRPWRGPSIDFLGTYWMLRYYSEVEPAATETPLPAWLGPTFS